MKEQTKKLIKDLTSINLIFIRTLSKYTLDYKNPSVFIRLNRERLIINHLIEKIDCLSRILCNYLEVLKLRKQEVEKELSDNF